MNARIDKFLEELDLPENRDIHKLYQPGADGWINLTAKNGTRYFIKAHHSWEQFIEVLNKIKNDESPLY